MSFAFIATALLAATGAAQSGVADNPTAKVEKPAAEKKICRREEATGSIMPGKRVCHTAAEWRKIDEANQGGVDSLRNRTGTRDGSVQ